MLSGAPVPTVGLTKHGAARGRERLSLSRPAMERLALHARERGQAPAAFVGAFRRYLDSIAVQAHTHVRVHGEHIFIFGDAAVTRLVTVLLVPCRFRRLLRRIRASEGRA